MNNKEILQSSLKAKWLLIDKVVHQNPMQIRGMTDVDLKTVLPALELISQSPILSEHPKIAQFDAILKRLTAPHEHAIDVHSANLKPVEIGGKSLLEAQAPISEVLISKKVQKAEGISTIQVVVKKALRESLDKILDSITDNPEKEQILRKYFEWLMAHYDNYTKANDNTSCATCYGPELVQSQRYAEKEDFYVELSDQILINAQSYADTPPTQRHFSDATPWSCHSGARGRLWQLFGQVNLSLQDTTSYPKEVSTYIKCYLKLGIKEEGTFSWQFSRLLVQQLSKHFNENDLIEKAIPTPLNQNEFLSYYDQITNNDNTITFTKKAVPETLPESLREKFKEWPSEGTKSELMRYAITNSNSLMYAVEETVLSEAAINRLAQQICDGICKDMEPLSQSWLFDASFYDPKDGLEHRPLYHRIREWLTGDILLPYEATITHSIRFHAQERDNIASIEAAVRSEFSPAMLERLYPESQLNQYIEGILATKEIERIIQENIDQDADAIIAKINEKFTSEQIQRLYPVRDPNEYIADKIKISKDAETAVEAAPKQIIQATFLPLDNDSLYGPIKKAYQAIVKLSLKEDAPNEHILFLTNVKELSCIRETISTIESYKKKSLSTLLLNCPQVITELTPDELIIKDETGMTVLHLAACYGHVAIAKTLIQKMRDEDLLLQNVNKQTALHLAVSRGYTNIAQVLIEKMKPEALLLTTEKGDTALGLAAVYGYTDLVRVLLEKMKPEYLLFQKDMTKALHLAVANGRTEATQILFELLNLQGLLLQEDKGTALHLAAFYGHINIVKALIEKMRDEDLLLRNGKKQTALHLAAFNGHTNIIKALIAKMKPEDLLLQNVNKQTALHLAIGNGHTETAIALIEKIRAEDLHLTNKHRDTALHLAVGRGYTNIARVLIEKMKPEYLLFQKDMINALHLAVGRGYTNIAHVLIEKVKPEALLLTAEKGNTALGLAAVYGYTDLVRVLLEKMKPEYLLFQKDMTKALHLAVANGRTEATQILFELLKIQGLLLQEDKGTALHLAAFYGHINIVKALIEKMKPEDLLLTTIYNETALHLAAKNGHTDAACVLLEKMRDEDLLLRDGNNETALHLAAFNGHTNIIKVLIEKMKPEDLLLRNTADLTALHLAAGSGHADATQVLLEKTRPEDLLLCNPDGRTALHFAASYGHTDATQVLLEKTRPEDLLFTTAIGNTALHLAAFNGHTNIIKALIEKMKPEDLLLRNTADLTALHLAAGRGHADAARVLIEKMKPEDLLLCNTDGFTALHFAAGYGHTDATQVLLEKTRPEDLLFTTAIGNTALHLAARNGHIESAKTLIAKMKIGGVQLNIKNHDCQTALDIAIENELESIKEELMNTVASASSSSAIHLFSTSPPKRKAADGIEGDWPKKARQAGGSTKRNAEDDIGRDRPKKPR